MGAVRYVVQSSRSCFRRWKSAPRMLTLLGMIACFTIIYALPLAENARAQGTPLQASELFVGLLNWRFTMLLFSTAILLLFGDLPVVDPFTRCALIRGTRKRWMAGQILYVIGASFLLTAFLFAVTLLIALPRIDFSNEWSRSVKLLSLGGRSAIPLERIRLVLAKDIVVSYRPWQAFGHCFALFFLMSCFFGLSSLALKLKLRSGAFILLMLLNALSWSTGMFGGGDTGRAILSIFSAHYHAGLLEHAFRAQNPLYPSLGASYAVFCVMALMLIAVALILIKRYDYSDVEDE